MFLKEGDLMSKIDRNQNAKMYSTSNLTSKASKKISKLNQIPGKLIPRKAGVTSNIGSKKFKHLPKETRNNLYPKVVASSLVKMLKKIM